MADEESSSSLCTTCGICCSGVLFDKVPVADDEVARLSALGFALDETDGETTFNLGCAMLCGRQCGVYKDRPATCRSYRCTLLKRFEAGEIPHERASELIDQALSLIEAVRPYAERHGGRKGAGSLWSLSFTEWRALDAEARANPENARHLLNIVRLNMLLDRHFRKARERRLMTGD